MRLYFLYIKILHKLHINIFTLHLSSPNFHFCCYICSQTLSLSAFLPFSNVFNLILGLSMYQGLWRTSNMNFHMASMFCAMINFIYKQQNILFYPFLRIYLVLIITPLVFNYFSHYSSSKIHLLSLLMDTKDSSLIVFLDLHILGIYDQRHHSWRTSMCDSWFQNVQFGHMSNI